MNMQQATIQSQSKVYLISKYESNCSFRAALNAYLAVFGQLNRHQTQQWHSVIGFMEKKVIPPSRFLLLLYNCENEMLQVKQILILDKDKHNSSIIIFRMPNTFAQMHTNSWLQRAVDWAKHMPKSGVKLYS